MRNECVGTAALPHRLLNGRAAGSICREISQRVLPQRIELLG
ncbi:hypothetical protein IMCC21224_111741 [Puniceibacterium sp. IMCC21224]|nr:hypothetical protein IMCC21224_111741 [Puniceibacterium sp. IMCC21224]